MVVVFGGVGNLWGTLVGAMSLGIANKFLEPYAGAVLGKILVLVFIILFIQRRPRGLFALNAAGRWRPESACRIPRAHVGPRRPSRSSCVARRCSRSLRAACCNLLRCRRHARCTCRPITVTLLGKYLCYALLALARRSGLGLLRHPVASATAPSSRSAATPWACT